MHPSGVGVTSQGVVDGSGDGVRSAGEVKTGKNYRASGPPAKIDDRLTDRLSSLSTERQMDERPAYQSHAPD